MTDSNNITQEKSSTTIAARIGWFILILATLYVCYFSHLGTIGFVGPDEPRYAWIARDMAETGDWVTPRLYGKPWFEKPPLFYWAAALSFKLFDVGEAAGRLPSAFSALLATLSLAWLALRLYGAETARWFLLLLPTTVGMIGFSHAAATDMPFSSMLTIAMVCAAVVLGLARNENTPILPRTPWLALILFGIFLGLAALAKGPAAIILAAGAIFPWALFTKRWRDAFRLFHPAALASFCLTALPWYFICARRNPDFFRIFIIEHNFRRYLTPEFQHIQPFWFYGPILILGLIPWTALLTALAKDAYGVWRENRWHNSPGFFFVCWVTFTVAFFTISKSKLPGYALPCVPPLGLLLARAVVARTHEVVPPNRGLGIASGLTLLILAVSTTLELDKIPFAIDYLPPQPFGWVILILGTAGVAAVVLDVLGRSRAALFACASSFILAIALSFTGDAAESLDSGISARVSPSYANANVSTYKLKRSLQYDLNFYLHREVPPWSPSRVQPGRVFTTARSAAELRQFGLSCYTGIASPAVIVCDDPGSADRLSHSGQPQ